MSKAIGYYTYTGATALAVGDALPLTNTVRQYGNAIRLCNNGVIIGSAGCPCVCNDAAGYYSVSVNTTLVASAAGPVTVTLYQDGQAVSGATCSRVSRSGFQPFASNRDWSGCYNFQRGS